MYDIAALLERAQVSAPISDKVVPQLLAQDVSSVAALLEAGSSAMAGGDGAAGERAGGGVGTGAAEEGGIGGGTEVSSLDPLVPALPTSGDGTIDAAREDEEEWAAAAAASSCEHAVHAAAQVELCAQWLSAAARNGPGVSHLPLGSGG
ncbi:hypothetical protein EMIHUDRAFT_245094 [Emiliania huxleyi CCMP1516]|uniref:Uncharacterized protein n=2 Tax=Emiliania huxleyi TaxID=2903 RepID=A0A0D3IYY0_EMIH1|nr:hypothetical protein EMIHUDRAFT_245094 [Emiliania huxleyi CCMP1516]EOD16465.1 hypothetical protein EMIHUDRAFT_245094 [Emiliania huxleyi CCMP1516]|eukprot:XP_005768894.1 hypothetical protein EMIHUDRAFT_245094 [Emiliania huxleyi CCMP1516]